MAIAWEVISVIVAVLIGAGISMLGMSPPDFIWAKRLFWSSAFLLSGMTLIWLFLTPAGLEQRWIVIVCIGLYSAVALPTGLFFVSKRQGISKSNSKEVPRADTNPIPKPVPQPAPLPVDLQGEILELYIQKFDDILYISKTYVLLKVRVVNHGVDEATVVGCALTASLGDFTVKGEIQNKIPTNWRIKRKRDGMLGVVYDELEIGEKLSAANVYKKGHPMVGWLLFEAYVYGDRVFPNVQFDLVLKDSFGNGHCITRKAGVYPQTGELIQITQNQVPTTSPQG